MVISPQSFKDVTSGFERRTNGLWTHTGRLVVIGSATLPALELLEQRIAQLETELAELRGRLPAASA
jgi:hypothetical protein